MNNNLLELIDLFQLLISILKWVAGILGTIGALGIGFIAKMAIDVNQIKTALAVQNVKNLNLEQGHEEIKDLLNDHLKAHANGLRT